MASPFNLYSNLSGAEKDKITHHLNKISEQNRQNSPFGNSGYRRVTRVPALTFQNYLLSAKTSGISLSMLQALIKSDYLPKSNTGWSHISTLLNEAQGNEKIALLALQTGLSVMEIKRLAKDKKLDAHVIQTLIILQEKKASEEELVVKEKTPFTINKK